MNNVFGFILAIICVVSGAPVAGFLQQDLPPNPPADHSLIYFLDQQAKFQPLPFEAATTPLKQDQVAKSTTTSYLELKGEHALTVLPANTNIYLFTNDRGGAHPPLIVWLTPHHGSRRVTAIAERGRSGFAISSSEIVRPIPRGLVKVVDEVFMELRPRASLMPGEYAIIGTDLTRVATFRVVSAAN
ncbi:MAG TPA: hypothetical protein VE961_12735 [Pyrinomonadaceae bacterium]|nr:hypothetical protein [Pyrinomonadaceae bacterium]